MYVMVMMVTGDECNYGKCNDEFAMKIKVNACDDGECN